ncbi:MAG: Ger(x)C family spore germination protein [Bacillota bacterium]
MCVYFSSSFAVTIGIDKALKSEAKYLITLEFAKSVPSRLDPRTESLITSVEADSILQGIQSIQTDISREISLSHLRVVVIGEQIAKEKDFKDLSNYLIREPKVALRLRLVFVQEGKARDIFYAKHNFQQLLGSEIVDFAQAQQDLSLTRTHNFLNFIRDLHRTKGTALGSRVGIKGEEKAIAKDGGAVFKNWKLAAWLDPKETQAANWLIGETNPIVVAKDGKGTYTYQVSNWDSKIAPVTEDGELRFLVKINTVGMVMEEAGTDLEFSDPINLKKMETLFQETIHNQVISAVGKSQNEIIADYLGFGKAFEQYYPEAFKSLDWDEVYPAVPIEIQVSCKVKGYGLRS